MMAWQHISSSPLLLYLVVVVFQISALLTVKQCRIHWQTSRSVSTAKQMGERRSCCCAHVTPSPTAVRSARWQTGQGTRGTAYCILVKFKEIEGKDWGLAASRDFKMGYLIFTDRPGIIVKEEGFYQARARIWLLVRRFFRRCWEPGGRHEAAVGAS